MNLLKAVLPQSVYVKVARKLMTTPMNAFSPNYSVKTVETRDEYFASLRLLHDCYVQKGLMNRDPRGIRLRIHHLLPESNILICKYKNEVVGTCTLVHRGRIPYPVQSSFPKETADALNISDSVVEISALAVHPDYRQKGNMIQLLMTKYLIQLLNLMYANPYVICSVHPKAEDFYKIFFSFHRAGDLIEYAYAGGAPGIFMSGIVSTEHFETYRESFRGDSAKTNIMDFQLASDSRLKFPNLSRELLFDSNYLNSLLRDIIPELLDDRKHLAEHKLHVIGELLKLMPEQNVRLLHAYNKPCYPYRLRTHLNPEQMPGFWLQNMNREGLLLKTTDFSQNLSLDRTYEFGRQHTLKAKPVRIQPTGPSRSELGIGMRLVEHNTVLEQILDQYGNPISGSTLLTAA